MTDTATTLHTFLRYKPGETAADIDLEEKIFQADYTYKCPTYVNKTPPVRAPAPRATKFAAGLRSHAAWTSPP